MVAYGRCMYDSAVQGVGPRLCMYMPIELFCTQPKRFPPTEMNRGRAKMIMAMTVAYFEGGNESAARHSGADSADLAEGAHQSYSRNPG